MFYLGVKNTQYGRKKEVYMSESSATSDGCDQVYGPFDTEEEAENAS